MKKMFLSILFTISVGSIVTADKNNGRYGQDGYDYRAADCIDKSHGKPWGDKFLSLTRKMNKACQKDRGSKKCQNSVMAYRMAMQAYLTDQEFYKCYTEKK